MVRYNNAEIYITTCTHPEYSFIKYIGLDTKKDPNYLGSSTVLKWFISKLGREYFNKEILKEVTGNMKDICKEEQIIIKDHNAVKDSDYLNMSGGTTMTGNTYDNDIENLVMPTTTLSIEFISSVIRDIKGELSHFDQSRCQLISRILCTLAFYYTKSGEISCTYNNHCNYGSCSRSDVEEVVSCMSRLGYISANYEEISMTDKLVELMPHMLDDGHFTIIGDING